MTLLRHPSELLPVELDYFQRLMGPARQRDVFLQLPGFKKRNLLRVCFPESEKAYYVFFQTKKMPETKTQILSFGAKNVGRHNPKTLTFVLNLFYIFCTKITNILFFLKISIFVYLNILDQTIDF